ncbi:MAG: prepilin-type N-terminal cleavage/methylation domain-containing protein, partial [Aeromonas veronii]
MKKQAGFTLIELVIV